MLAAASPDARLASPWLDTPRSTSMLCFNFNICNLVLLIATPGKD
jgi:hypothetical protein